MSDESSWESKAKARLAAKVVRKPRPGSAMSAVSVLLPEIRAARAAGKTWGEIAADLSDPTKLSADSVRIAYHRCSRRKLPTPQTSGQSKRKKEATGTSKFSGIAVPDADETDDLFAPMFDARDMRGRNREQDVGQAVRS